MHIATEGKDLKALAQPTQLRQVYGFGVDQRLSRGLADLTHRIDGAVVVPVRDRDRRVACGGALASGDRVDEITAGAQGATGGGAIGLGGVGVAGRLPVAGRGDADVSV